MSELIMPLQIDAYTIQICSIKGNRRVDYLNMLNNFT